MKKAQGISLIEILFVIAIGAVIICVMLRYFGFSSRNIRVAHAIHQINMLTKVSYKWLASQDQDDFSNSDGGKAISMQQLLNDGFIKNANYMKDPWKGDIIIQPGSDPHRVQITLMEIPKKACKCLAKHLDKSSKITMPSCASIINDYTGEF